MGAVDLEMLAMVGFVLAILFGSVLLLRARRDPVTVLMVIAAVVPVLGLVGLIGGRVFLGSGPASIGARADIELYPLVTRIGGLLLLGGLVVFAFSFVGFGLRQAALERRAEELEGMMQGLSERMGEEG